MLRITKASVAILAFGSNVVFAGSMGSLCTSGQVTVPCERSAWDFGVRALYLLPQFAGSQNNFATLAQFDAFDAFDALNRHHDNWNWGFQIEGSYHFNTGNDISMNWYHLEADDNDKGTIFFNNSFSNFNRSKWDAVNSEWAQSVHWGVNKTIRFHGGFQYARLVIGNNNAMFDVINPFYSNYNGFGPRTGMHMNYLFDNGFSVYAKAATALLIGSITNQLDNAVSGLPLLRMGSITQTVPEMDATLGANYKYAMAQGDLTLDVGYIWFNYFNAVNNGFTGFGVGVNNFTDFSASGPYLGLKYVGNV